MLSWTAVFLIIALIAGLFGFTGIVSVHGDITLVMPTGTP